MKETNIRAKESKDRIAKEECVKKVKKERNGRDEWK